MITSIGHIALEVPDLDASAAHAVSVLGLREAERTDDSVFFSVGHDHFCVQYIAGTTTAIDHVGLRVADSAGLAAIRERVLDVGVDLMSPGPDEPGIDEVIRFAAPGDHVYEVYPALPSNATPWAGSGVPTRRFGHVTLSVSDLESSLIFLRDVLGFKESDFIDDENGPMMVFLRCNPDHHGIAMLTGPDGLSHYAFEVDSVQQLARLGDVLEANGKTIAWGPGRHGPGQNIAAYHLDGAGALVEHYSDLQRIYDDEWEPQHWLLSDYRAANLWGPVGDLSPMVDSQVPVVSRPASAPA